MVPVGGFRAKNLDHLPDEKAFKVDKMEFKEALDFASWLEKYSKKIDWGSPRVKWKKKVYRIVCSGYEATSILGSFYKGGRFNVCSYQAKGAFSQMKAGGCLYGASTFACAIKEVGRQINRGVPYILTPKKELFLWDLLDLVEHKVPFPNLKESVESLPSRNRWESQQFPKVSQILASFLRSQGGDGIIYPSTKDNNSLNLAFFLQNDRASKKLFEKAHIAVD